MGKACRDNQSKEQFVISGRVHHQVGCWIDANCISLAFSCFASLLWAGRPANLVELAPRGMSSDFVLVVIRSFVMLVSSLRQDQINLSSES